MKTRSGSRACWRWVVGALLGGAALVAGTPEEASAGMSFLDPPPKADDPPEGQEEWIAGQEIPFHATARFAPPKGEDDDNPWLAFDWQWGDGTSERSGFNYGAGPQQDDRPHTYSQAAVLAPESKGGQFVAKCTAFHGFKGEGFKFQNVRTVKVSVLPSLPLRIGAFKIDGAEIERVGPPADRKFKVKATPAGCLVNDYVLVSNDVIADFNKNEVILEGTLGVPLAGDFANVLGAFSNLTFDAATGSIASTELPKLEAKFELAKFKLEFTNFKIAGGGVEFDFLFKAPRLTEDSDLKGKDLVKLEFKRFRIDNVPPYLHTLGDNKITISNLKIKGTDYGLESLELGFNFGPPEKYSGAIMFSLPSDRGIGGEIQFVDGQLDKLSFTAGLKIPVYTLTGVGDAVYLRSINAQVRNLAVVDGLEQVPTIAAGELDPGSLAVTTPGIVLEWGAGVPIVEGLEITPVTLDGAAEFDANWNVTMGGELTFFKDKFGTRFRVAQVRGSYQHESSIIKLQGALNFDNLFALAATATSSFDEYNYFHAAVASGTINLPEDHWAHRFVPTGTGTAVVLLRASPTTKYLVGFRGSATVPVLGERSLGFQIDLVTGEATSELDTDLVAFIPGKAESRSVTLTGGQGDEGMIVRLLHTTGAATFNLRRPNGTLITPASADNVNIAYAQNSDGPESTYLIGNAEDGTWTAEFDDAGLGTVEVRFLTPRAAPEMTVSPLADAGVAKYDALPVTFAATGLPPDTPVHVYLDDDGEWGGGYTIAQADDLSSTTLNGSLVAVPPGTYRVVVEADPADGLPVFGTGAGNITVREYRSLDIDVAKGALTDDARPGKDKFSVGGTIAFNADSPDDSFDVATDALELRLGDATAPLVLSIPAGDAGWSVKGSKHRWRGPVGAAGKATVQFDPVKRKLSIKLTGIDFPDAQANPLGLEVLFGDDRGILLEPWTANPKKPGSYLLR